MALLMDVATHYDDVHPVGRGDFAITRLVSFLQPAPYRHSRWKLTHLVPRFCCQFVTKSALSGLEEVSHLS